MIFRDFLLKFGKRKWAKGFGKWPLEPPGCSHSFNTIIQQIFPLGRIGDCEVAGGEWSTSA